MYGKRERIPKSIQFFTCDPNCDAVQTDGRKNYSPVTGLQKL